MPRTTVLHAIEALDPARDHERIVYLSTCMDFPFDTTRALEFALFRTFSVPSISALLDRTGEFRLRPQKRYDDTDLIVSELLEWGYSSDRGTRALARMNAIHGRFRIANADFLYVLSTFVFEPIRWNARFGWRPLCPTERLAYFHFWREIGRRMGLADLPADYDAFERFNRHYEARHFRFTGANAHVGGATVALFAGWAPRPLAPFVRRAIYALLDEPCRAAFGFPRPRPPSAGWPAARCGCAPGSRASCPRAAAPACAPRPRTRPIPPATRSRRSAPADRPTRRSRSPLRPRLEAHRPFP